MEIDEEKLALYKPYPDARLNPCSDVVFKALFTDNSDESRTALRCFLSAVLHKQVKNVSLKPNEIAAVDEHDKAVRFDVACTFNDGESADVEMQGANDDNAYGQRAEYLCARLLNSSFQRGKKWNQMKRVYQISVLNFVFDRESKVAVRHFHMKDDEAGHFLSNGIQTVIFLELPKIARLGDVAPGQLNSEEKWCKFLLDADNPEKKTYVAQLAADEGGIMEAQKTLDKISEDWLLWKRELDRDVLESDRATAIDCATKRGKALGIAKGMEEGMEEGMKKGMEEGMKKGIEKGMEEGRKAGKIEAAQKFKKLGVATEIISQATGLTAEEITSL
jgi:predicted transposase/invertase (TIGR01784 family)